MNSLNAHIRSPKQLITTLKRIRQERKLTQSELGEFSGLPQTTVSKIEVEAIDPGLDTLFKLLAALDLEIEVKERNPTVIKRRSK